MQNGRSYFWPHNIFFSPQIRDVNGVQSSNVFLLKSNQAETSEPDTN